MEIILNGKIYSNQREFDKGKLLACDCGESFYSRYQNTKKCDSCRYKRMASKGRKRI